MPNAPANSHAQQRRVNAGRLAVSGRLGGFKAVSQGKAETAIVRPALR